MISSKESTMKILCINEIGIRSRGKINDIDTYELILGTDRTLKVDNSYASKFLRDINSCGIIVPVLYNEKKMKYFHEIMEFMSIINYPDKVQEAVFKYLRDRTDEGQCIEYQTRFICEEIVSATSKGLMIAFEEEDIEQPQVE